MTLRIERWTLAEIAERIGGELTDPDARAVHPSSVSTDTRSMETGALFVALAGENFDGHDYLTTATEKGACAAIVSSPAEVSELPKIVVRDTLVALQQLGAAVFADARADGVRSIALTGSNGKTTTKELIAALWSCEGDVVHATKGNFNNHVGVPLTLCATPVDATTIVIEMGANQFGDIELLVGLAPADVRVITSIGYAHIERLQDLDGVRRAKSEIFEHGDDASLAVVPESERMRLWLNSFSASVATVGGASGGGAVTFQTRNGELLITGPEIEYRLKFSLPGTHNQHNLATAIATLLCGDWRPSEQNLQQALDHVKLPGGRWRRTARGPWLLLDDAYNANPSSVRASWDTFVEIAPSDEAVVDARIIAVFGEMRELGEEAEQLHRDTAAWVAGRGGANIFIFVGPHGQAMAEAAALQTQADVEAFEDAETAGRWLAGQSGGVLFLKASRGQALERLIEYLPE